MGTAEDAARLAAEILQLCRDGDPLLLDHVDEGVPVDLTDADGNNLVLLAAHGGSVALVEGLVARGVDVDHLNHRGQGALAGAVQRRDAAMVRALVGSGADPDRGTPTARETARMLGRDDLLPLLDDVSGR